MANDYHEDDFLQLSGIQHFAYCERQWGLIHIESQWVENLRTAEGRLLHERVDDPYFTESRGDVKTVRSVPLSSKRLGLYGIADVLELHRKTDGNKGLYDLVEYKRGKPKPDDRDEVQLCAQAICLEEMLGVSLEYGYIYYGEIRHRHQVRFDEKLRLRVRELAEKMHTLYKKGVTPQAEKSSKCNNCSMIGVCLPKLGKNGGRVDKYMKKVLHEMKEE